MTIVAKLPALKWLPSPNFSSRKQRVSLIVIHDCQGGYEGSIATFQGSNGGNPVSAHFVLKEDGSEATQMVHLADKAWHCVAFNSQSIGIEMAGFEGGTVAKYKDDTYADGEWGAAEAMTAQLCQQFGVPVRYATNGVGGGICRHADLGRAGGGHTDPTRDMKVWDAFIAGVAAAHAAGGLPAVWGR